MIKCVVIVTYEPNLDKLKALIRSVMEAGCVPVIVDNSERMKIANEELCPECLLISMPENVGIAMAQNVGIKAAMDAGAEVIGFFDQDSEIADELIPKLISRLNELGDAVVVPVSLDKESGKEYPSALMKKCGGTKDVYALNADHPVPVDFAISSGTFTTWKVMEKAGLFDEDFFIDFVDIEWCLRCRKSGIKIYVIPDAILYHKIGIRTIKKCGLTISVHSPYRTYYKVRNGFLLRRKKLKSLFVTKQILVALVHNFLLTFDKTQGKEYRKYYYAGLRDGIRKKTGKYIPKSKD